MEGKARCRRWAGLALLAVTAVLVGCRTPGTATSGPPAAPDPSGSQGPDLSTLSPADLSRDEVRAGLFRLLNESGQDPEGALEKLTERWGLRVRDESVVPYLKADLDGNGLGEYVLALPVTDPSTHIPGQGAALFVIHRQGDRFEVDRSDPMSDRAEFELMRPYLHGVADLTNSGRLQIVWSRPHVIATGPQPHSVFVTEWTPGSFRHLPGEMVISTTPWGGIKVAIEGRDLVLAGGSRRRMETGTRVDRYRYQDGAFRLADRRFVHGDGDLFFHLETEEPAYGLFWDGVVAEAVGQMADAEAFYRAALDPARRAHPGTLWQHNTWPPRMLDKAELAAFDEALRTLARFRLAGVLLRTGRAEEAAAVLRQGHGRHQGLLDALRTAPSPTEGCRAAAEWAEAHPDFVAALNLGGIPWEPQELCAHPPLEDSLASVEDSLAPLADSPAG